MCSFIVALFSEVPANMQLGSNKYDSICFCHRIEDFRLLLTLNVPRPIDAMH